MQNQKSLVVAIVVIGLCIIAGFFILQNMDKTPEEAIVTSTGTDQNPTTQILTQIQRESIVTSYIKAKIGELSPEFPVLGGIFYVTDITFTGPSKGEVMYEDGHVAFVGDFNYSINEDLIAQGETAVQVTITTVRNQ